MTVRDKDEGTARGAPSRTRPGSGSTVEPPLLVVGHGTRDDAGVAEFGRLIERLRRRMAVDVAGGFIELSPPPLTEAVAELYDGGHRLVAAVPLGAVIAYALVSVVSWPPRPIEYTGAE